MHQRQEPKILCDLRSDTVTRPTVAMRQAMFTAEVGDDVYGEDPAVNELQDYAATLFGMEAALFCPSGTMCNQIAIRLSTQPQDEVICDRRSHIYLYEGGGIMANSLASVQLLEGDRGRLSPDQIEAAIQPDDPHFPVTRLVSLENTVNKAGGACYELEAIARIRSVCVQHHLRLHLDGARLFNACVATGTEPTDYGRLFDTISVCLSKGLGAPVGSLLLGTKADLKRALRVRKMMGGGMRQAGFLAAAGLFALQNHLDRLAEDHHRARTLAHHLQSLSWVKAMMPVETNIVVFQPDPAFGSHNQVKDLLARQGVLISAFGPHYLRMVTHLDFDDDQLERVLSVLTRLEKAKV